MVRTSTNHNYLERVTAKVSFLPALLFEQKEHKTLSQKSVVSCLVHVCIVVAHVLVYFFPCKFFSVGTPHVSHQGMSHRARELIMYKKGF